MSWDYGRELFDYLGRAGIGCSDGDSQRIAAAFSRLDRGQQRRAATHAIDWLRQDETALEAMIRALETIWPNRFPRGESVPDPDPEARWWRADVSAPDWWLREHAYEIEQAKLREDEARRAEGHE